MPQIDLPSYLPTIFVFLTLWSFAYICFLLKTSLNIVNPPKLIIQKKKNVYLLYKIVK
jgi:hypothetical protein